MDNLYFFLSRLEKKDILKFGQLVLNSFITGILEVMTLASIIPLLHVILRDDNEKPQNKLLKNFFEYIDTYLPQLNNIYFACLIFIVFFFIKNLFIFFFFRSQIKFSKYLEIKFSTYLIDICVRKNYSFFIKKKKSSFLTLFSDEILMATRNYIGPMLVFFTEIITMISFLIAFLYLGQLNLILVFFFYFFFGILILKMITKISKDIGEKRAESNKKKFFLLNNIFSNIRYLILENKRSYFFNLFKYQVERLAEFHKKFTILSIVPRIFMEIIGITSILTMILYLVKSNFNTNDIIIISSIFLMATYKIVPSFNKILGSYSTLTYGSHALRQVFFDESNSDFDDEETNLNVKGKLKFDESFELKNVNFKYPSNSNLILKELNLKIKKGDKIGIFGESGSGKSTLVDIISGLNKVDSGDVLLDNNKIENRENFRKWQNQISYVSQNSVLLDDSVRNNITFFENSSSNNQNTNIENEKLNKIVSTVQLSNFVKSLPNGLDTPVGDLGNQLSGGQIQRIAIARALYKDKDFLILDEPTSALDEINEAKIIEEILKTNKTIILISHDIKNLKKCNYVFELKNKIISIKSF